MGYGEFAPFPFILPSIAPMSFPIKLPDDGGSLLTTLAPGRSQSSRATDDETPIYGPEIPPIERERMRLQQKEFISREHAAASPDRQFSARFIMRPRHRNSRAIDENRASEPADSITGHAHNALDQRHAGRQITTPFDEPLRP